MSWARGHIHGREVGYGVADICNRDGCDELIDRGLGYLCGEMHGDYETGCTDYFCPAHLADHDCDVRAVPTDTEEPADG